MWTFFFLSSSPLLPFFLKQGLSSHRFPNLWRFPMVFVLLPLRCETWQSFWFPLFFYSLPQQIKSQYSHLSCFRELPFSQFESESCWAGRCLRPSSSVWALAEGAFRAQAFSKLVFQSVKWELGLKPEVPTAQDEHCGAIGRWRMLKGPHRHV